MSPFSASSTAPREEGKKWCLRAILPLFFKLFQDSFVRQTWTWWSGGLGFPFPLLGFGLGEWLLGHFYSHFVYRGSLVLLGFGPLVDHWDVRFDPPWTEKNGPLHRVRLPHMVVYRWVSALRWLWVCVGKWHGWLSLGRWVSNLLFYFCMCFFHE